MNYIDYINAPLRLEAPPGYDPRRDIPYHEYYNANGHLANAPAYLVLAKHNVIQPRFYHSDYGREFSADLYQQYQAYEKTLGPQKDMERSKTWRKTHAQRMKATGAAQNMIDLFYSNMEVNLDFTVMLTVKAILGLAERGTYKVDGTGTVTAKEVTKDGIFYPERRTDDIYPISDSWFLTFLENRTIANHVKHELLERGFLVKDRWLMVPELCEAHCINGYRIDEGLMRAYAYPERGRSPKEIKRKGGSHWGSKRYDTPFVHRLVSMYYGGDAATLFAKTASAASRRDAAKDIDAEWLKTAMAEVTRIPGSTGWSVPSNVDSLIKWSEYHKGYISRDFLSEQYGLINQYVRNTGEATGTTWHPALETTTCGVYNDLVFPNGDRLKPRITISQKVKGRLTTPLCRTSKANRPDYLKAAHPDVKEWCEFDLTSSIPNMAILLKTGKYEGCDAYKLMMSDKGIVYKSRNLAKRIAMYCMFSKMRGAESGKLNVASAINSKTICAVGSRTLLNQLSEDMNDMRNLTDDGLLSEFHEAMGLYTSLGMNKWQSENQWREDIRRYVDAGVDLLHVRQPNRMFHYESYVMLKVANRLNALGYKALLCYDEVYIDSRFKSDVPDWDQYLKHLVKTEAEAMRKTYALNTTGTHKLNLKRPAKRREGPPPMWTGEYNRPILDPSTLRVN